MKTSKLLAMIIALLVSAGGFEAINLLFTNASTSHERRAEVLASTLRVHRSHAVLGVPEQRG